MQSLVHPAARLATIQQWTHEHESEMTLFFIDELKRDAGAYTDDALETWPLFSDADVAEATDRTRVETPEAILHLFVYRELTIPAMSASNVIVQKVVDYMDAPTQTSESNPTGGWRTAPGGGDMAAQRMRDMGAPVQFYAAVLPSARDDVEKYIEEKFRYPVI